MLSANSPCFVPAQSRPSAKMPPASNLSVKSPEFVPKNVAKNVPKNVATLSVKANVFIPAKIYPSENKDIIIIPETNDEEDVWVHHGLDVDYSECSNIPPSPKNIHRLKEIMQRLRKIY